MGTVVLGSTGMIANKNGFGALPIQRITKQDAIRLVRMAYDGGVNFYDTARLYNDSEEKLGEALRGIRENVYISSKSMAPTARQLEDDLTTSLSALQTDYVDAFLFHNPDHCPKPGDGTEMYETMLSFKQRGMVRHIGISNHRMDVALESITSGLYELLEFPFSYLSSEKDLEILEACNKANMGFVAMKALAGGMLTRSDAAYAFMCQFDHVLPIWGLQRESELGEFLSYEARPPVLDDSLRSIIESDRDRLQGDFCRGCGYCMPCPVGIDIPTCARMAHSLKRALRQTLLGAHSQAMMKRIELCKRCMQCAEKCPYGLNTPELLEKNLEVYRSVLQTEA